jgi:hypothetical protein
MQTSGPLPPPPRARAAEAGRSIAGLWAFGEAMTWSAGLVLMVSAFTDWYAGNQADGLTLAVIGWHTGTLGKLVFACGFLVVLLVLARELVGIELPRALPEPLVVILLGMLATIFVLIRLIKIPDTFLPAPGRGVGIWISLAAAIAVIVAGLLRATEEL